MYISAGYQNQLSQYQTPAGVGIKPLPTVNQDIANNRVSENGNRLDSAPVQNISYSPQIRDDRASRVQDSRQGDDNSRTNSLRRAQEDNADRQNEQEVQQVLNQLEARDREVRAHEMAHLAAAGQYARGLSYTYQTGPDGKQYAVGGEVGIDTSPVPGDPEATIVKAQVIQRAALAPAEPSAQDRRVAQAATQMMAQARVEISQQQIEGEEGGQIGSNERSRSESFGVNTIQPSQPNQVSGSIQSQGEAFSLMSPERQSFTTRLQFNVA